MQGRPYILCGRPCFVLFSASALWYADGMEGVTGMVVYWDLAALVNGAADYLLLLSAARLAGRTVPRLRLLGARPSARPTPCSGLFCRAHRG